MRTLTRVAAVLLAAGLAAPALACSDMMTSAQAKTDQPAVASTQKQAKPTAQAQAKKPAKADKTVAVATATNGASN